MAGVARAGGEGGTGVVVGGPLDHQRYKEENVNHEVTTADLQHVTTNTTDSSEDGLQLAAERCQQEEPLSLITTSAEELSYHHLSRRTVLSPSQQKNCPITISAEELSYHHLSRRTVLSPSQQKNHCPITTSAKERTVSSTTTSEEPLSPITALAEEMSHHHFSRRTNCFPSPPQQKNHSPNTTLAELSYLQQKNHRMDGLQSPPQKRDCLNTNLVEELSHHHLSRRTSVSTTTSAEETLFPPLP
ncbi:uncharacterized protein LOC129408717 [Boleophthalmus pectinirostris]|uniref:uncharacterized protein LOC129408717 n=1 Tax=Boleophthalmus pectinirostris TaxID=150288 RepID=UPI0024314406|nr:uncharacterized protein LOC129408717 [Boleophthalmus pectinirostris]